MDKKQNMLLFLVILISWILTAGVAYLLYGVEFFRNHILFLYLIGGMINALILLFFVKILRFK